MLDDQLRIAGLRGPLLAFQTGARRGARIERAAPQFCDPLGVVRGQAGRGHRLGDAAVVVGARLLLLGRRKVDRRAAIIRSIGVGRGIGTLVVGRLIVNRGRRGWSQFERSIDIAAGRRVGPRSDGRGRMRGRRRFGQRSFGRRSLLGRQRRDQRSDRGGIVADAGARRQERGYCLPRTFAGFHGAAIDDSRHRRLQSRERILRLRRAIVYRRRSHCRRLLRIVPRFLSGGILPRQHIAATWAAPCAQRRFRQISIAIRASGHGRESLVG